MVVVVEEEKVTRAVPSKFRECSDVSGTVPTVVRSVRVPGRVWDLVRGV